MALFRILGIEFSHLPADAEVLQHHCAALWEQYQSLPGVSCELLREIMREFRGDFTSLELHEKEVVSDTFLKNLNQTRVTSK